MTKLSEDALKQEITNRVEDNTTGLISAADVRTTLIDMVDSLDIRPDPVFQVPQVSSFSIQGQSTSVDAGTTLSGSVTFLYNINNPGNVNGNLTLTQAAAQLANNLSPSNTSAVVTINSVTLNAAEEVIFTLSGVDTQAGPFSGTFTVTALSDDEYLYFGSQISQAAGDFTFGNEPRAELTDDTTVLVTIPTFSGSEYLVIAQPTTSVDFSQILLDGLDQSGAFTKNTGAVSINAKGYDVWISNRAQLGSVVSGEQLTLVR